MNNKVTPQQHQQAVAQYVSSEARWLPMMDWNVKFFGAHQQQVANGWYTPQESHIGFELLLIVEGIQETVIQQHTYTLNTGDLLLIPPGFKHINRCISDNGMNYFCAHFNIDDPLFRQALSKHIPLIVNVSHPEYSALYTIIQQWLTLLDTQTQAYSTVQQFRLQSSLFELFAILAQMVMPATDQSFMPLAPSSIYYAQHIAEQLQYRVKDNIDSADSLVDPIRIEDIACSLGISNGHALDVFRQVYGLSPRRYLSELKLNQAKVLIQQPDRSLYSIATTLGYSSLSHFSRQFKRWTGLSPLQYRSQSQLQNHHTLYSPLSESPLL